MRNGENLSESDLEEAQAAVGYRFRGKDLLLMAFTHKSYSNVYGGENNERLEFLGDSVLQLCITEKLYKNYNAAEGTLTEIRKRYVSQAALEQATERAGIKRFLRYSGGENNVGGKTSSNLFEAVTGAIYLDGGYREACAFIARFLKMTELEDYKTLLQEYVQKRSKATPVYTSELCETGYVSHVRALGVERTGTGESLKAAEKEAAKNLYLKFVKRYES